MTTIVISCAAALFATALAVIVFVLGRRSRGATDAKLFEVAAQLDTRMQSMVRELSGALERAQEEGRRSRFLGELGGSIDLDEVLSRTLEAAGALEGVDASVISIAVEGGEPLVAAVGLGGAEPPSTITGPPDGRSPRTIVVEYGYGRSDEAVEGGPFRAALAVPLVSEGEQPGYLATYSRTGPQLQRGRRGRARAARAPRRAGDRQRAPVPRGTPARRPRRADRAPQPALLPRDACPGGVARAPLRAAPWR